ncbi:MAG: hypothetical protein P8X68_22300, partial [Desulfobacterales bacterium]
VRAQSEAEKVYGYDEDHGSILTSERVLTRVNQLMDDQNVIRKILRMPEVNTRWDVDAVYGSPQ